MGPTGRRFRYSARQSGRMDYGASSSGFSLLSMGKARFGGAPLDATPPTGAKLERRPGFRLFRQVARRFRRSSRGARWPRRKGGLRCRRRRFRTDFVTRRLAVTRWWRCRLCSQPRCWATALSMGDGLEGSSAPSLLRRLRQVSISEFAPGLRHEPFAGLSVLLGGQLRLLCCFACYRLYPSWATLLVRSA